MNPDDGPSGTVVIGQLTVAEGAAAGTVSMGMQGRSAGDADDWQERVSF
eukprot:COSAG06_NODE_35375_length_461_cov_0.375691_2_plen_48_part_01